jgi:hypothetical protein
MTLCRRPRLRSFLRVLSTGTWHFSMRSSYGKFHCLVHTLNAKFCTFSSLLTSLIRSGLHTGAALRSFVHTQVKRVKWWLHHRCWCTIQVSESSAELGDSWMRWSYSHGSCMIGYVISMSTGLSSTKSTRCTAPWEQLHAESFHGDMFLIVVDTYLKWLEVKSLMTATCTPITTTKHLCSIYSLHRLPRSFITDNRPQFTSVKFETFMRNNGIRYIKSYLQYW